MLYILSYNGTEIQRQAFAPTRNTPVPKPDGSHVWIPPGSHCWRTEPDPSPPPEPTPAELAAQQTAANNKRFGRLRKARDVPELVTAIERLYTGDGP